MGISDNLQPLAWAVTIPFIVITVITCLLRFYSRACIAKCFGLDDWAMVAASSVWLGQQFILMWWIMLGGGRLQEDVPAENMTKITTLLFVEEFVYILTQWLIKLAFLLFYLRIWSGSRGIKLVTYVVTAIVTMATVATWLIYALQCIPIDAFFHPERHPDAKCIPIGLTLYIPASLNVFGDIIIYLLPVYPLWKLQMPLRRRIGLIACFTLGGGTILVSLLRFIVLVQLAHGSKVFYVYGSVVIVTTIEFCTAIITANMPSLVPVWKKLTRQEPFTTEGKSSHHERGTVSGRRSGKSGKLERGNVGLKSKLPGGVPACRSGSEEDLIIMQNIVITKQVDITAEAKTRSVKEDSDGYCNFPAP